MPITRTAKGANTAKDNTVVMNMRINLRTENSKRCAEVGSFFSKNTLINLDQDEKKKNVLRKRKGER
jgi:hypothetical protein